MPSFIIPVLFYLPNCGGFGAAGACISRCRTMPPAGPAYAPGVPMPDAE